MSMYLVLGVPMAVWLSGAALIGALACLGVMEWGQRNLHKRKT